MKYLQYLLPGDELVADEETLDFHKGYKYKVVNVYRKGRDLIFTVFNKKQQEVIFENYGHLFKTPKGLENKLILNVN